MESAPAAQTGWWSRWGRGRVAGWWRARLDDVPGTLVLYRTALAFPPLDGPERAAGDPREELRRAAAQDGALVLDLADGARPRFAVRNSARAAGRFARTLPP